MNALDTLHDYATPDATGRYDEPALDAALYAAYTAKQISYDDARAVFEMACSVNDNIAILDDVAAMRDAAAELIPVRRAVPRWMRVASHPAFWGVFFVLQVMIALIAR